MVCQDGREKSRKPCVSCLVCVCVAANGVECGVAEWVRCGALRWFGHSLIMGVDEFVKSVKAERIEGGMK